MYTYEIWNKKDSVKGFSPEYLMERNPHLKDSEVILFKNKLGVVERIEAVNTLIANYDLNIDLVKCPEKVAEQYISIINKKEISIKKDANQELLKRIEKLELIVNDLIASKK